MLSEPDPLARFPPRAHDGPMVRLLALAPAVLLLAACASRAEEGAPVEALTGRWVLLELPGAPDLLPEQASWRPHMEIAADGSVTGNTGVNSFSGALDPEALLQGRFALGPVVATEMAGRPEAMRLEQRFLQELQRARRYGVDGDRLELLADGDVLLRFTRAG